ncbi:MAG: hypothetical protein A2Y41_03145 [Spirochaetes bacterium GWB1_36_13]|nr:MAG: hypothetical protein A2Y41_03145 [Spirochaetes bacterium GWB1_36_13]
MTLQDFSYIGGGLAGLAGLIAALIAYFQLGGLRKSVKYSNLMAIFNIEFELNRRKERLANIRTEILKEINGRDSTKLSTEEKNLLEIRNSYKKEAMEDYLNAFDRLSYFILKGKLEEDDFRLEFRDMLFDTIESDKEDFFGTGSRYRNMKKLYEKWKDK